MFFIAILFIIVAVILVIAGTKPNTFQIERQLDINATPDKIFTLINDFHQWSLWSPWEQLDPDMKRTYSGAAAGQGAVYEWTGNKKVGAGRMEILSTTPPTTVTIKLDFIKPVEGHNTTVLNMTPAGDQTNVRWEMHGPNTMMGKIMSVFISMDKMVGKDFERGLANLKAAVEEKQ
jgi:uncharacterized protein YndB with AHSA1/START domain